MRRFFRSSTRCRLFVQACGKDVNRYASPTASSSSSQRKNEIAFDEQRELINLRVSLIGLSKLRRYRGSISALSGSWATPRQHSWLETSSSELSGLPRRRVQGHYTLLAVSGRTGH